jgi:hypothetical protein
MDSRQSWLRHLKEVEVDDMVLQVLTNAFQSYIDWDTELLKLLLRANPTQHEDLRRVVGSCREDDLLAGRVCSRESSGIVSDFNPRGLLFAMTICGDDDPGALLIHLDSQVARRSWSHNKVGTEWGSRISIESPSLSNPGSPRRANTFKYSPRNMANADICSIREHVFFPR